MNEFFYNWYTILGDLFSEKFNVFYWGGQHTFLIPIGLCMLLIPIILLTLYYYVINSAKLSKWWHWLILVAIICATNFSIAYGISSQYVICSDYDPNDIAELTIDCLSISCINTIWCFIISLVWSLSIKWGSTNCRRTPF